MGMIGKRKRKVIEFFLISAFLIVLSIIPFETTIIPKWKIQAVNKLGKPVENVEIRQVWNHYSFDYSAINDKEETLITDNNGFVVFPKRTIRASFLERFFVRILDMLKIFLPHSSQGIQVSIICINKSCNWITYTGKEILPNKISVKE